MKKCHSNSARLKCLGCILLLAVLLLQLFTGCTQRPDDKLAPKWKQCVVQINYDSYARFTEFYIFQPTGALDIYSANYSPAFTIGAPDEFSPETMPGWELEVSRSLTQEERQNLLSFIQAISPDGTLTEIPQPERLEGLKNQVQDGTIEVVIWLDGQSVTFYDNAAIRMELEDYPHKEYADFRKFIMTFIHENYERSMEKTVDALKQRN